MGIFDSFLTGPEIDTSASDAALKDASKAAAALKPIGFQAGGLTSKFNNGVLSIKSNAGRKGLVGRIASTFPEQAAFLADLRSKVAPGFSDLRAARLGQIENARVSAVGDLKENLQRRRVLGSSFAGDAVNRAELTFGQEKDKVAAETFMHELALTHELIGEEYDVRRKQFETRLGELNLQADLGTKLHADASSVMAESAKLQAELASMKAQLAAQTGIAQANLDAQAQAGAGKLFGTIFGEVPGGGLSSLLAA